MSETIRPALTAEEWADWEVTKSGKLIRTRMAKYHDYARRMRQAMPSTWPHGGLCAIDRQYAEG